MDAAYARAETHSAVASSTARVICMMVDAMRVMWDVDVGLKRLEDAGDLMKECQCQRGAEQEQKLGPVDENKQAKHATARTNILIILSTPIPRVHILTSTAGRAAQVANMQFFLLALFAFMFGQALAYEAAGAYERMWYWNAYLVDTHEFSQPATKIAPDCHTVMAAFITRGRRYCDFNQFIQYIENGEIIKKTGKQAPPYRIAQADTA